MGTVFAAPELRSAAEQAGVVDLRVLEAIERVPRGWFAASDERDLTRDAPLQIGYGQTTSQPSLVARILETLELHPGMRVLEVGTGLGYEAALLAWLVAPTGRVVTVERDARLARAARRRLERLDELDEGIASGVHALHADGMAAIPMERGPFDAIVVAAATSRVPAVVEGALADGGRLVIPLDEAGGTVLATFTRRGMRVVRGRDLGDVRFVPLVPSLTGLDE